MTEKTEFQLDAVWQLQQVSERAWKSDRRRFIQGAIMAMGVAGTAFPGWDKLMAAESGIAPFFSPARMAVLDAVAEAIVPRTDSPGARDAKVPQRLDTIMHSWASPETQATFNQVLDEIDAAARAYHPKGIAALSPAQQLEVVAAFDALKLEDKKGLAAMSNSKYLQTATGTEQSSAADPGYRKFKHTVLSLYYLSEPGALQELRYQHVPGAWEPSLPVTPETRSWAVEVGV